VYFFILKKYFKKIPSVLWFRKFGDFSKKISFEFTDKNDLFHFLGRQLAKIRQKEKTLYHSSPVIFFFSLNFLILYQKWPSAPRGFSQTWLQDK
jgi:hypothetical protein